MPRKLDLNKLSNKKVLELCYLSISCKNNSAAKYNHQFDQLVKDKCNAFCEENNIDIIKMEPRTSAYQTLNRYRNTYFEENINDIIEKGEDTFGLYKAGLITDKQIVNELIKLKQKEV